MKINDFSKTNHFKIITISLLIFILRKKYK